MASRHRVPPTTRIGNTGISTRKRILIHLNEVTVCDVNTTGNVLERSCMCDEWCWEKIPTTSWKLRQWVLRWKAVVTDLAEKNQFWLSVSGAWNIPGTRVNGSERRSVRILLPTV